MANYKLEIKKSAVKEINHLPTDDLKRVLSKIEALSINPRPQGSIKLSVDDKYRLRVGDYRILYTIEDKVFIVCIVKVGHRKEVYRK